MWNDMENIEERQVAKWKDLENTPRAAAAIYPRAAVAAAAAAAIGLKFHPTHVVQNFVFLLVENVVWRKISEIIRLI